MLLNPHRYINVFYGKESQLNNNNNDAAILVDERMKKTHEREEKRPRAPRKYRKTKRMSKSRLWKSWQTASLHAPSLDHVNGAVMDECGQQVPLLAVVL